MPIDELETHPYLNEQITDFTDKEKLSKYCKLIVGTFPIYVITDSEPIEQTGLQKRANWQMDAFMQYFYGSFGSHFWEFLALAFDEQVPGDKTTAIELLDKYKICITDVFSNVSRIGYSPLDINLRNLIFNQSITTLIQNSVNLKIIYFTSKFAKIKFCHFLNLQCLPGMDTIQQLFGNEYRMIILPSPAGGGRTVPHFFNSFPLSESELNHIAQGNPYAFQYRSRYYMNYLSIPCD